MKKTLSLKRFQSCQFGAPSARSQLWCFFGICSLHWRYEILFSFFLPCGSLDNPWYLDGSDSLAGGKKRWRASPLTVLAECDLVFSPLWGPRAVIWQRSRGIWDVILPGISRDPKQIVSAEGDHRYRRNLPLGGGGWGWGGVYGNVASRQETTEQHPDWSALTVTPECDWHFFTFWVTESKLAKGDIKRDLKQRIYRSSIYRNHLLCVFVCRREETQHALIPYCQLAPWCIILTTCWWLQVLIPRCQLCRSFIDLNLNSCQPLTLLTSFSGHFLQGWLTSGPPGPPKSPSESFPPPTVPLILYSVAPCSCTNWPPVLFGLLGLLPGSSILSILPQIQSLSLLCTCPNHLSLASLTLSTEHLACSVTLKYTFLILSIHITAKTPLWPSSLLPVCCYLLHTPWWFLYHLMIMFSHSFPPPLPSQVLLEVFPCSKIFFLTNVACSGTRLWASMNHYQITSTPPDYILIKLNWVELNRFDSPGRSFRIEFKCLRGGMWNSGWKSF